LAAQADDVLVVAQKVVSKAEGRAVVLARVEPTPEAAALAGVVAKDPRLVQVVLDEAVRVVRAVNGVLIVETRHGLVCANGGVDQSNTPPGTALRLPVDPDRSAAEIRAGLARHGGTAPAVIVSDSHGRAWRVGTVGIAIGAAGLDALLDLRGQRDLYGRVLEATIAGRADELAAAAILVMGEGAEGTPAALVRGARFRTAGAGAGALRRSSERDLFR
jgi:coenzyme F420-0:L-glutamate ligase/coenzyme F420-1:gamma-L-glutamate ligase